jgi:hypothetical protein
MSFVFHDFRRLAAFALLSVVAAPACAEDVEGKRVFAPTVAITDPGVGDTLSLPEFNFIQETNDKGGPGAYTYALGWTWMKTITPNLAFEIASDGYKWEQRPNAQGWGNLDTQLKYVFWDDPKGETQIAAAFSVDWGNTGSPRPASIPADPFSTLGFKIFGGKGFGEASADWARPVAITGEVSYYVPTSRYNSNGAVNPSAVVYGATLQYSLLYMNDYVQAVPEFFRKLIPAFEASFTTPVGPLGRAAPCPADDEPEQPDDDVGPPTLCGAAAHVTTGVVGPSVYYIDKYFQTRVLAQIPINPESGHHLGVMVKLDIPLDQFAPDTIGKPLFATSLPHGPY